MISRFKGALLTWLVTALSLWLLPSLMIGAIVRDAYHPSAPGAHLNQPILILACIGLIINLFLSVFHSLQSRRSQVRRNAIELAIMPVAFVSAIWVWDLKYGPKDLIILSYLDENYAIPRVYVPRVYSRADGGTLMLSLCTKNGEPQYDSDCNFFREYGISTSKFTNNSDVRNTLDNANATYSGDVISSRGDGVTEMRDGSFSYMNGSKYQRFLLNEDGLILRFADCYSRADQCEVFVRTELGILSFPSFNQIQDKQDFWRNEEAEWMDRFNNWRCADASCSETPEAH
ncbi:hypothetical protein [Amaricoccus tamworthensis]|uniref:hypothetical protein n=1 Tax=Amaricoccus tamworthensis TaxID=57002 RepID=UPI003C7A75D7